MMNHNEKLTFAEFHQKLLKYCSNGARYSAQEKDILSRFEKLIVQRDACIEQLIIKRKAEMVCSEDISDSEHQLTEIEECLERIEKKCNLLTLEQLSNDAKERPDKQLHQQDALEPTSASTCNKIATMDEVILNKFLRKFCNIYVRFCVDTIRVLSLADNQFFEFSLRDNNVSELREQIWSSFVVSSVHLSSWENLL